MPDVNALYDDDFAAWAKEQAGALRAAAAGATNRPIDWQNVAEEIEELGKSHARALRAYMSRIVQHLVKLEHSVAIPPRPGWRRSIRISRLQVKRILDDNPSLRAELARLADVAVSQGIELALIDLEEYGEADDRDLPMLRRRSYTLDQIIGDWFPEPLAP